MTSDALGDRMKEYECVPKVKLIRRTPVVIRLDARSFHTFTRGFEKPFDNRLSECMQETMRWLCENIQNCKVGYTQSDEISLLMIDYVKLNTEAWFDNNVQKIVSIASSMATMKFNELMGKYVSKGAMFDARAFNLPRDEVNNYFLWRQNDASKNSVQMFAQAEYSQKELTGLKIEDLMDKLFEKGINWNDAETYQKRGSCAIKVPTIGKRYVEKLGKEIEFERTKWIVDDNTPIFSKDLNYIEQFVYPNEM